MHHAIRTQGLLKRFKTVTAVDHIDLLVPEGQIFGLLGPNAAGKSTTIRLLSGIMAPDGGTIEILGMDLVRKNRDVKQHIGYVAQHFAVYQELTVRENLEFYSGIYRNSDKSRHGDLLGRYGLDRFMNNRAGTLSGGFKRRLSIACAVAHDPDLIFLDEPTAGIDPVTRKELWELFYELAAAGKTLFVTTHYMEEAERCNHLAFIHHGVLITQDTPNGLKRSLAGVRVYACNIGYRPDLTRQLSRIEGVKVLNQFGNELRIVADEKLPVSALEEAIFQSAGKPVQVNEADVRIEDVFMTMTGS
jgi:ABC-2 type transport system ATP-binding protein